MNPLRIFSPNDLKSDHTLAQLVWPRVLAQLQRHTGDPAFAARALVKAGRGEPLYRRIVGDAFRSRHLRRSAR